MLSQLTVSKKSVNGHPHLDNERSRVVKTKIDFTFQ